VTGWTLRAEAVAVTVSPTIALPAVVDGAVKLRVVLPVELPTQPAAALTVYAIPEVFWARRKVWGVEGDTMSPLPTAPKVTTRLAAPMSPVPSFTVTVAEVPGPVAVLHVTAPVTVVVMV
jgi:hypothetical protein